MMVAQDGDMVSEAVWTANGKRVHEFNAGERAGMWLRKRGVGRQRDRIMQDSLDRGVHVVRKSVIGVSTSPSPNAVSTLSIDTLYVKAVAS